MLQSLDLSMNNLTGTIPEEVSHLSVLWYLNTSDKNLEGGIPAMLGLHFENLAWFSNNPNLSRRPLEVSYEDGKCS
ncbi:hypothetical protein Taro_004045 [Colocasia esculenta]|uniref:Uncharacterized protein n=1 Tax=Colocasia esculenta TaxID=4460 RepID=A0A843TH47_COLES|nr:hypothetical protein [Colocasia esculenta]